MKTSFWTKLFDLLSPRQCAICGGRLSANESAICSTCMLHMSYTDFHLTPTDNQMVRLFWGQFPVERAASLFYYEPKSEISQLIYNIKYYGRVDVCEDMGRIVANYFNKHQFFEGIDAIIPMPITLKRRWQRGYNQSLMIAKGIQSVTLLPIYNDVVKRRHFHGSQTDKNQRERRENVEGAFQLVNGNRVAHKHILLVDDITTTGATVIACASELCKAENVKVSVLTLGYTKT